MKKYLLNLGYALDLLLNTLFGGERHQTVSARWGASQSKTVLYYYGCRLLHLFDRDHCGKSAAHYAKIKAAREAAK